VKLASGSHLAYCTNIHRGDSWDETFASLRTHSLAVRNALVPREPFAIGLRLSAQAATELQGNPNLLRDFRHWLDRENCYVVAINGFPYGRFHGTRVKEQVYAPDWSTPERLAYTQTLFDLLDQIAPPGESIGVSTLPGSFKEFVPSADDSHLRRIQDHLLACSRHIDALRERSGRDIHLGLEPEPLGLFETSQETVEFMEQLLKRAENPASVLANIGVNYDTCHLAVEYEEAGEALGRLRDAGLRISKLHLSSALRFRPDAAALAQIEAFQEEVYLHQVIARHADGSLTRYRDLPPALEAVAAGQPAGEEWRVHFHIPLHEAPMAPFADTRDHLLATLDAVRADPGMCPHLEMETYTWEVLPGNLRHADVTMQLIREYEWTLAALRERDLA
jgi:hypothetical protein